MILNPNNIQFTSKLAPLFENLQKQKENQKMAKLFEIGATFVLISFFTFFAIKPTFFTISSLIGEIKSKELLNKELKNKINDVIIAQDLFSQVQEKYSLVESSLPNNPHFYQAVSQIINPAESNQLIIDKLDFSLNESNYFTTSISTSSSFLSALSFVSGILQNRRLIGIDNFSLSTAKDVNDQKIIFSIPLKVYYWPNNVKK